MKKNKLSVITFIISLLPFITLLISLFTEEITGGLQTGLIVLNGKCQIKQCIEK